MHLKFLKDISALGGQRLFLLLVQTVTSVLVSRTLGPDHYGALAFAMSLAGFCALPAMSGMAPLMVREAGRSEEQRDWHSLSTVVSKANLWTILISLTAMTLMISYAIVYIDTDNRKTALLLAALFIPLISLTAIYSSLLQGFGQAVYSQSLEWMMTPFIYGFLVMILWVNTALTIETAISASLISILIPLVFMIFKTTMKITDLSLGQFILKDLFKSKPDMKWLAVLTPFFLLSLSGSLNNYIPSLLLGFKTNDYLVGIYRVSESISAMTAMPLLLVNMLIGRQFVALYARKDMAGIEDLGRKSARVTFIMAAIFAAILFWFGREILEFLYGKAFVGSYDSLIILVLGQIVNVGSGSVALILNMTGFERDTVKVLLISTVLNISLCMVLVPLWQETGAAIASAASLSLWNAGLVRLVHQKLAIRISVI